MDLLHQLSQETGKTLVTSLQVIEFVGTHYQRIIGLRQEHILFNTNAEALSDAMVKQLYNLSSI